MITQEAVNKFKELYEQYCLVDDAVFVINMGFNKTRGSDKHFRTGFYWLGRPRDDVEYTAYDDLRFDIKLKKEYRIDVENNRLVLYYNDRKYNMMASYHSFSRSKMYKEGVNND